MGNESVVQWGEPPLGNYGGGIRHEPIAAELKSRPGEWGHIGPYKDARASSQIAYAIRTASLAAYQPAGSFEARGRQGVVYIRYVGESNA